MISLYLWIKIFLTLNSLPPAKILPILEHTKSCYLVWYENYLKVPKSHRYTLALKIDNLFIEIIEGIAIATFLQKNEKIAWLNFSIRKLETLNLLLQILWETKSLNDKKYIQISNKLNEIGKMLGGWRGKITENKNSPK